MYRLMMPRLTLLITVPFLLAALAFPQTPAPNAPKPNMKIDQINLKGCIGGTDPDYTVAEDQTGRIVKITPSGVDLKPHLGHDVKLVGHNASGSITSAVADNSFIANALTMISDHCAAASTTAAAAAALGTAVITPSNTPTPPTPAATVTSSTETVTTPAAAPAVAVTVPAVVPPAVPAVTVSTTSATVTTPATPPAAPVVNLATPLPLAAPAAAVTTTQSLAKPAVAVATPVVPTPVASAPAVEPKPSASSITDKVRTTTAAVSPARMRKHHGTAAPDATPDAQPSASTDAASAPAAPAPAPTATAEPASTTGIPSAPPAAPPSATTTETNATPGAATLAPAPKSGFPLWLGVAILVLVLALGGLAPLLKKKRQMLGESGAQNLAFTSDPASGQGKLAPDNADKAGPRKVA